MNPTLGVDLKGPIFTLEEHVARLAQSVEHETLNLGVVGSSPTLGDDCFATLL